MKYNFKRMSDSDKKYVIDNIMIELWAYDPEVYHIYADSWDAENVFENIYLNNGIDDLIEYLKELNGEN